MRIALCLKYIPSRNYELKSDMLWSTIDGLREAGFEVVLATQGPVAPVDFPLMPLTPSGSARVGFRVARVASSRLGLHALAERLREWEAVWAVKKWMRCNNEFEAVVALCTDNHAAVLGHAVVRYLKKPLLIQEHKNYEHGVHSLETIPSDYLRALKSADFVAAVSPFLADMMVKLGVRSDVNVIPNSLSDEFFHLPDDQFQFTWARGEKSSGRLFVYGAWTRWREIKRLDLLLMAFKEVHLQHPDTRLFVAGPIEPESNACWAADYIKENGLEEVVRVLGSADREQIHKIAHGIDCGVLPSDYETFGLPALEALAAGKPVVTTRCNGPEWLVRDDRFGRCVDRGSSEALAEAMLEVYEARDSFDHEFIRSETWNAFSRTVVARQWADAIRKAVSEKG